MPRGPVGRHRTSRLSPDKRNYDALRTRLHTVVGLSVLMFLLSIVLFFVEASGGHDGYLCEWGYDMDGAASGDTGCE